MWNFLKKLFTLTHIDKPIEKQKVMLLVRFPKEDREYATKEICRARLESLHGISSCGHCTPDSQDDLLAFAAWKKEEIEPNLQLVKSQLPEKAQVDCRLLKEV